MKMEEAELGFSPQSSDPTSKVMFTLGQGWAVQSHQSLQSQNCITSKLEGLWPGVQPPA